MTPTPSGPPARPDRAACLAELDASTDRFLATAQTLSETDVSAPSGLPGWSRGHVLAHVARNADGLGNLVDWAATGVETPMYASREARAAAIDADAGRSAAEHLRDLLTSAAALRTRLGALPVTAEDVVLRMVSGAEVEAWEIVLLRIREVEIHHVDLAAGYRVDDWSDEFARRSLDQVAAGFAGRDDVPFGRLCAPDGASWPVGPSPMSLHGPAPLLLGWLVGRSGGHGLEPEGRADVPPAPPWS